MAQHTVKVEHFKQFQKFCLHFKEAFGLKDWEISVLHVPLDDGIMASFTVDCFDGRICTIALGRTWKHPPTPERLMETALHEMLHLLFADMLDGVDIMLTDCPAGVKRSQRGMREHGAINRLMPILLAGLNAEFEGK
jgi:hypothetical protein